MVQVPAGGGAFGGYQSLALPQLLAFIENLGDPGGLQATAHNWADLSTAVFRAVGNPFTTDPATLNGMHDAVQPVWQGAGADAYAQHFGDLSNFGMDVAARAGMRASSPTQNFATFAKTATDASTALNYVRSEARKIPPQGPLTDYASAVSAYQQAGGTAAAASPAAVNHFAAQYNGVVEQNRQRALQLVQYLDDVYSSLTSSLPTKPTGAPHTVHTGTTGGSNGGGSSAAFTGSPNTSTQHASTQPASVTAPGAGPSGSGTTATAASGAAPPSLGVGGLGSSGLGSSVAGSTVAGNPSTRLAGLPAAALTPVSGGPVAATGTLPNIGGMPDTGGLPNTGGMPGVATGLPVGTGLPLAVPGASALPGEASLRGESPLPGALKPGAVAGLDLPPGLTSFSGRLPRSAAGLTSAGLNASVGGAFDAAPGALPGGPGAGDVSGVPASSGAASFGEAGANARVPLGGANTAALGDRAAPGGVPMAPMLPMGGMGGMGGQGGGGERRTWLDEDEDVWSSDTAHLPSPVVRRTNSR